MKKLNNDLLHFFREQGCVVVVSIDKNGFPHGSCKGIVHVNRNGKVYLFDLYRGKTHENLLRNHHVSIIAFDEHKFIGYCLKGKAKVSPEIKLNSKIVKAWEERIATRITHRLLKNIKEDKGLAAHPELALPKPKHLIIMDVEEVVNLSPAPIKTNKG
ncbi:MAG: pyridoxamine 5'-phosphate oxidase family protein [Candidatus Omnitrophica bacterium]|nr:pyridoxamine 5'-phosphate oxidase family protein [Candidatus Omnitrophota bacterium]